MIRLFYETREIRPEVKTGSLLYCQTGESDMTLKYYNMTHKIEDPSQVFDIMTGLSRKSERLETLRSLLVSLSDLRYGSESLQSQISDFTNILTRISEDLEKKSLESGDSEVWKETETMIDLLYDLVKSPIKVLEVFSKDFEIKESEILTLLVMTSDHYVQDMIETLEDLESEDSEISQ